MRTAATALSSHRPSILHNRPPTEPSPRAVPPFSADRAPRRAATSWDPQHPQERIIDGKESTFWSTTGMFPQEVVITLGARAHISRINTVTNGVRRISVEVSKGEQPVDFDKLVPETDISNQGGQPHSELFTVTQTEARHVKVVIHAGWDHFVALHSVEVLGQPV